jgi:plastocyanin
MMIRRMAAIGSIAILLAACSGAPSATVNGEESETPGASVSAPAGARTVDLEIGDGVITPASVEVTKGETVTFNAKNVNTTEVELIVGLATDVAADSGDSLKEAEEIAPGASKSVTYTFDGDGPYAYGDQIGDHYSKGAKGVIVLK